VKRKLKVHSNELPRFRQVEIAINPSFPGTKKQNSRKIFAA
jgi:hypothetical protein